MPPPDLHPPAAPPPDPARSDARRPTQAHVLLAVVVVVLLVVAALLALPTEGPGDRAAQPGPDATAGPAGSAGPAGPAGVAGATTGGLPDGEAVRSQLAREGAVRSTTWPGVGVLPAGRPARTPTHPDENRHVPPPPTTSPAWVGGMVLDAPVLLADTALPWRYSLSTALSGVVDEAAVHEGATAWDGIPGSRWATSFAGWTTTNRAVADGRSTIFLDDGCEGLTNANAYLFTDGGLGIGRHGASGTQILEADIGICPRATATADVVSAVRHEVGHVIGLGHLCNLGEACWDPGMGEADHACRVMFWQARDCQVAIDEGDRAGVRARYGTIRPLRAPSNLLLAARVAFATLPDDAARLAVVVDEATTPPPVLASAAALAGRRGGALLLDQPDPTGCLTGPAREEVNRTLRRRGTLVLVGEWPATCHDLAFDWDLALRTVPPQDPATMAVLLADVGGPGDGVAVFLGVDGDEVPAVAGPAAALAAVRDAPLLLVGPDDGPAATTAWLAAATVEEVLLVGTGPAAEDLAGAPGVAVRDVVVGDVAGADPVDVALAAAGMAGVPAGATAVLAGTDAPREAVLGAVLAGHEGGVLLLTPPTEDARVRAHLAVTRPATGWAVGDAPALPAGLVDAYASEVG